ncbi:MAG: hypothetical protein QXU98_07270 [Candidatus Parvarchaeota archaeon]
MVNPDKSRKKNGIQVCVLFPFDTYNTIISIMSRDRSWFKEADFIRDAVKEKIERWNKEHGAYGHPGRAPKKEENKKQEDE